MWHLSMYTPSVNFRSVLSEDSFLFLNNVVVHFPTVFTDLNFFLYFIFKTSPMQEIYL